MCVCVCVCVHSKKSTVHVHVYLRHVQALLKELHSTGKLTSLSLWKELYQTIAADDRYHAMLGQPGERESERHFVSMYPSPWTL